MGRGIGWDGRLRKSSQHIEGLQIAVICVVREGLHGKVTWLKLRRLGKKDMFLNGAHMFTQWACYCSSHFASPVINVSLQSQQL